MAMWCWKACPGEITRCPYHLERFRGYVVCAVNLAGSWIFRTGLHRRGEPLLAQQTPGDAGVQDGCNTLRTTPACTAISGCSPWVHRKCLLQRAEVVAWHLARHLGGRVTCGAPTGLPAPVSHIVPAGQRHSGVNARAAHACSMHASPSGDTPPAGEGEEDTTCDSSQFLRQPTHG